MVRLDEKCLIILEKLNENSDRYCNDEILYNATKPTQYRGLHRRLNNLEEADLITTAHVLYRSYNYKITDFGMEIVKMLKPEKE
jgi:DNA-binding HxlR family transcriptional regulator